MPPPPPPCWPSHAVVVVVEEGQQLEQEVVATDLDPGEGRPWAAKARREGGVRLLWRRRRI